MKWFFDSFSSSFASLFLVTWLVSAVLDYCRYEATWQLKEYRLDKFLDFVSTKQGKKFLRTAVFGFRFLLALLLLFWPINFIKLPPPGLIFGFLLIDVLLQMWATHFCHWPRPRPTAKALGLLFLSLLVEFSIVFLSQNLSFILIFYVLRFYLLSFLVWVLSFPTKLAKKILIMLATKKINSFSKLRVIGITGSFGKTTVKTFLSHILSAKFNVIATPGNINTEVGVAKFILEQDWRQVDIFIVEMGAYRVGEIKLICDMVRPSIGILTAINAQHLSLFGSLPNIQQAKYELLRSLPSSGLAITNSDNPFCREFLSDLPCQVQTFGIDKSFNPTYCIFGIESVPGQVHFKGRYKDKQEKIVLPTIGEHQVFNAAPCLLVGYFLGIGEDVIRHQLQSLKNPDQALSITSYGQCTILNDTYNSNPDGFRAALQVLASFPSERRRLVVTRGMMELGEKSEDLHERIGEEISFVADELIVTTPDFYEPMKRGVNNKYHTSVKLETSPEALLQFLVSQKETKAVILFENRLAPFIYKEIFGHSF